ncbi:MAG: peptidylprolyl isomerase [Bdellovibrionia bacterium]
MKSSLVLSILVVFSLSAFAQKGSDVVASIGNKRITLDEFNKKFNEVRLQTMNPPTKAQFLEDLIRYEVGVQEAEKRKLNNDPIVQERMKQELYKSLLEKDLGQTVQKIQVSDKEMKDWYAKNPELKTSHILIEYKPDATPAQIAEARKRAQEIFAEVQKSKRPFEELVKLYSDDPLSKQVGGDVGWQSRVTLMPSYYEAALGMKIGEIRGLIETPFGFHIVKLTGKRSFENANKRQIRAAVFDEKRRIVFNNYFEKLKRGYDIKSNPAAIQ